MGQGAQERRWVIAEWGGRGQGGGWKGVRLRAGGGGTVVKMRMQTQEAFFTHYINDCACSLCLSTVAPGLKKPSTNDFSVP